MPLDPFAKSPSISVNHVATLCNLHGKLQLATRSSVDRCNRLRNFTETANLLAGTFCAKTVFGYSIVNSKLLIFENDLNDMNPQTLTTRANSEHFGHNENVKSSPPRVAGKSKKSAGIAKVDAAPPVHVEHQPSAPLETTFKLDAPHAHDVLLAGCFTQWEKSPVKMLKGGGGVWHAKVTLKPGNYQYRFIVDGQWQNDPHSHNQVGNPYGSQNSVLEIR